MNFFRKRIFLIPLLFSVLLSVCIFVFVDRASAPALAQAPTTEVIDTVESSEKEKEEKVKKEKTEKITEKEEKKEKDTTKENKESKKTDKQKVSESKKKTEKTTSVKSTESKTEKKSTKDSSKSKTTTKKSEVKKVKYEKKEETVYATGSVYVRKGPGTTYDYVELLEEGDSITRVAVGDNGWSKVMYNDKIYYMPSDYLSTTEPYIPEEVYEETYSSEEGMVSSCGMTAEELEGKLSSSLKDYSEHFIEAEKTYGVNAAFLAAVAALESGWGESYIAQNYNNLFGWRGSYGYIEFDSVRDCIMTVAQKLKTNYLSPDGCYFNGYTIADINVYYNGSAHWLNSVTGIYNNIMY